MINFFVRDFYPMVNNAGKVNLFRLICAEADVQSSGDVPQPHTVQTGDVESLLRVGLHPHSVISCDRDDVSSIVYSDQPRSPFG